MWSSGEDKPDGVVVVEASSLQSPKWARHRAEFSMSMIPVSPEVCNDTNISTSSNQRLLNDQVILSMFKKELTAARFD